EYPVDTFTYRALTFDSPLPLHDALPISRPMSPARLPRMPQPRPTTPPRPQPQPLRRRSRPAQGTSPTFPKSSKDSYGKRLSRRRSEEHTSELQSRFDLVCRLLLEKKKRQ